MVTEVEMTMSDLSNEELEFWPRAIGDDPFSDYQRVIVRAIAEVKRHRAMVKRLEAWAEQLDEDTHTHVGGGTGVGPFISAELRNRMKGG